MHPDYPTKEVLKMLQENYTKIALFNGANCVKTLKLNRETPRENESAINH